MPIYYDGGGGVDSAVTHPIFLQAVAVVANGGGAVSSANSTHVQKLARALANNSKARAVHARPFRRIVW
jgi:hypothetical protein